MWSSAILHHLPFTRQCISHLVRNEWRTLSVCAKHISTKSHNTNLSPFYNSHYLTIGNSQLLSSSSLQIIHGHQKRCYAKGKNKGKDKGKKGGNIKTSLSHDELNSVISFDKMVQQMVLVQEHLKQDFTEHLTLRTSAGVFDNLMVETPDGKFPLIQIGQVAQKNPQLIIINMATMPQYLAQVKTAIAQSGMNLNPQQDGTSLFVPIPKITKEYREGLVKNAKNLGGKAKEKLRDIQNKFVRDLKKHKAEHSEDLIHNINEMILAETAKHNALIDHIIEVKQKELLGSK